MLSKRIWICLAALVAVAAAEIGTQSTALTDKEQLGKHYVL